MNGLTVIDGERIRLMEELLSLPPAEKAFIEVSNVIATTPIDRLTAEALLKPLTENEVSLEAARPRFRIIYAHVLKHFVLDRNLTDQEESELAHLKQLLGLTQADVEEVFEAVVSRTYEHIALRASADEGQAAGGEKLLELSRALKIPEEVARGILSRL